MRRSLFRVLLFFTLCLLLSAGCAGRKTGGPEAAAKAAAKAAAEADSGQTVGRTVGANGPPSQYLQLVDGLHVTGTPVEVDSASFRLAVGGAVERPLSLSLEQIRALPAVREQITLNCPGFFTDRGVWTGVPVRDLLALAGVKAGAAKVVFTSLSQGYTSTLSLEDLQREGAGGYPGRRVAYPGTPGYHDPCRKFASSAPKRRRK
jgi:DMSO/TMAO reductase YedYZ molybdopterin-dependent catalytic subunit